MLTRSRPRWWLPESQATPETVYAGRRRLLSALGIGGLGLASARARGAERPPVPSPTIAPAVPTRPALGAPAADLYPAKRNPAFALDRPLSVEDVVARSNIFDEFGDERSRIWEAAAAFSVAPWRIHIGGAVEAQITLDAEALLRRVSLEERLYRHRCVETWAMAVPWTGFPLRALVEIAKPLAGARFVRMLSLLRPDLPGWTASRRVFPYYEALSMAEAMNPLAFIATGIYGHPLPMQHGAPLRLVVPWKYGYKSLKSVVAFQFTRERPGTFWNELSPTTYGFEANVDPTSTQPWPQAEETLLGSNERRKTLPFNGYAAEVAALYA